MRILSLLFALPLVVACSPALQDAVPASTGTSPPVPDVAPAPSSGPAAPPARAQYARLNVGEVPGSSTHQWGSRYYEVRQSGRGYQVRLHDAMSFQGSGMAPGGMPPTQHSCTAWETLPDAVADEVKASGLGATDERACGSAKAACDAIGAWMKSTAKPAAPHAPSLTETMAPPPSTGRSSGSCAD